ncbi:hypothetical protein PHYPSEUDO_014983 [Phytophthora pseudosyringae]|uniref:Uncharacterized protein n=1 Tax=Phytophthora pseudosyringae TaxID=221518 RepID=A0A8T1WH87_9STRA|nr:hypothetical protein PHYPSEUDO_014983 [Phytophthora pseudosyringae]
MMNSPKEERAACLLQTSHLAASKQLGHARPDKLGGRAAAHCRRWSARPILETNRHFNKQKSGKGRGGACQSSYRTHSLKYDYISHLVQRALSAPLAPKATESGMSARASRRAHAAAYGALPSGPISDIRTRKWTKQPKAVGHLTIPKWVPDQENPTEALQKGTFKKSKGRKRGAGEVGRMTRSVRQHLDAPLELLSEYPVRVHSSRHSSPARTAIAPSTPARTPVPMPSPDATPLDAAAALGQIPAAPSAIAVQGLVKQELAAAVLITQPTAQPMQSAVKAEAAPIAPLEAGLPASTLPMMPMLPPVSNQMLTEVPSDEQLEMVLDDLPLLDADDSFNLDALDPAFLPTPAPTGAPPMSAQHSSGTDSKQQSAENSSASVSEDDASGSSMPSASPQSSPGMMSRSPSP